VKCFDCTVVDVDDKACQESGLDILENVEGYISGAEMLLAQCVLAFNMAPGQRLNVTVLDFTANSTAAENRLPTADGTARCPSSQVRVSSSNPVGDQLSPQRMRSTTAARLPAAFGPRGGYGGRLFGDQSINKQSQWIGVSDASPTLLTRSVRMRIFSASGVSAECA